MKNRYIDRYVAVLVLLFSWIGTAYSQIRVEGPEVTQVGTLNKYKITQDGTRDLKILILKAGQPYDQGWFALKDLDDTPVIMFVPQENGLYTLVVAANQDNKTFLVLKTVQVGPRPDPDPEPKQGFAAELKQRYLASPDTESLDALIEVFTEVKKAIPTIKNFGDFEVVISNVATRRLAKGKLQTVRERIGDYLLEQTGDDPRAWDPDKANRVCDDILTALKACK
jgi:hypothetical protein